MSYSTVIWDWNGTLFADVDLCIRSMNLLLKDYGLAAIPDKQYYREIFCFPVIDYYRRLGFDFEKVPFEKPALEFIDNYRRFENKVQLAEGAEQILKKFSDSGKRQLVLSASERNALIKQIEPFGIMQYFSDILGIDNHFAESKAALAKAWFEQSKANPEQTVFVGDTVHDFDVAHSVGCDCILVSCGHQCESALKATGAVVVEDISALWDLVK